MADAGEADYEITVIGTSDPGGGGVDVIEIPAWMYDFDPKLNGPQWVNPPNGGPTTGGGGNDTPDPDPKEAAEDIADAANLTAGAFAVAAIFTDGMSVGGYVLTRLFGAVSAESWLVNGVSGHIAKDPPQEDYAAEVLVQPRTLAILALAPRSPIAELLRVLVDVEAIGRAFIDGAERYQGACLANDMPVAFRQLGVAGAMAVRFGDGVERLATSLSAAARYLREHGADAPLGSTALDGLLQPGSASGARLLELVATEPGFAGLTHLGLARSAAEPNRQARRGKAQRGHAASIGAALDEAVTRLKAPASVWAHPPLVRLALRRRVGLWSEP